MDRAACDISFKAVFTKKNREEVEMMQFKRAACTVMASMLMLSGLCVNAQAAEGPLPDQTVVETFQLQRAENGFDLRISGGHSAKADTGFWMGAGETITIRATYTPVQASLDVGVEGSDGTFYYTTVTGGSINKTIRVPEAGNYKLAIRNNASVTVKVSGYVNY